MRYLVIMTLLLAGCTSVPVLEPRAGSWVNQCYPNFERDVSDIAGDAATECGFLPLSASKKDRALTESCAKSAVRSEKPFKFWYGSFGDDSAYCHVAIRAPNGQLISFFLDSDVTGQMARKGSHSVVWTSRCAKIEFKPGTIGRGSFFDLEECTEAPEIFSSLPSCK
jgi:hypothetical protein